MGLTCNGWSIRIYPALDIELLRIEKRAARLKLRDGDDAVHHPAVKLQAAVTRIMLDLVPADPGAPEFRQGTTLGKENKHWFRAKFHRSYRLFYRYSKQHRVIVYAWMSNEDTLRKAGSKTDPYTTFAAMLRAGNPPEDLDELLRKSRSL